jgi:hypothetical protein
VAVVIVVPHLLQVHPTHAEYAKGHSCHRTKNHKSIVYLFASNHLTAQFHRPENVGVVGQSEEKEDGDRSNGAYKHKQVASELVFIWIPEYHNSVDDESCQAIECHKQNHISKLVSENQRSI